ncbi:DUF4959 domain-containing protein [Niabella hirudinis]|uniref:DUF4959 domain-containing protein n=1 Tax=Niabella hirudinis TaxID=1285929 RepID=UPI003EBE0A83
MYQFIHHLKTACPLLLFIGLVACTKSSSFKRDPVEKSTGKPSPVKVASIDNLNGAADVHYTLPDDPSILYVQADYMINGTTKLQEKVSKYASTLHLKGFGNAASYKVQLYAVNAGEEKSDPVEVTVQPTTPPYLSVRKSLVLQDAFGGVNVTYQNLDTAEVGIILLTKEKGRPEYAFSEYTGDPGGDFTKRGYSLDSRDFGAYVIDKWGNISDTIWKTINPLYEVPLDKNKIANGNLPGDAVAGWGTNFNNLFNHTGSGNAGTAQMYGAATTAGNRPMITFYLGQPTKLSRLKFWAASNEYYKNIAPRVFQIWVSEQPNPNGALDDTWTQIGGDYEIKKPSGQPVGSNTAVDDQTAASGWEFAFPLPPVKSNYVRIVGIDTWGANNDTRIRFSSFSFWGDTRQ